MKSAGLPRPHLELGQLPSASLKQVAQPLQASGSPAIEFGYL